MRCPKFQYKKLDMQRQMHEFSKDILFGNFRVLIILPIAVEMFLYYEICLVKDYFSFMITSNNNV